MPKSEKEITVEFRFKKDISEREEDFIWGNFLDLMLQEKNNEEENKEN